MAHVGFVQVFSWVGLNGLFTFIKVYIARLMQASGGRTNLLYIGTPALHATGR